MPPKRTNTIATRIPIFTLSGGVGRQAPSKRLPSEAQNIDNAFVTLERSISKRSGYEFVRGEYNSDLNGPYDAYNYDTGIKVSSTDMWFYWFDFSATVRYLIMINYDFEQTNSRLLSIFKVEENSWKDISNSLGAIPSDLQAYLTYRPENATAKEALRAVTVGQNIIILNRYVKAGFSSDDSGPAGDSTGDVSAKFQVIDTTTGWSGAQEIETTSEHGSGLRVTVTADEASNFTGINSIIDAGTGYKLNEIVTLISPSGDESLNATVRVLDPVNFLYGFDGLQIGIEDVKGRPIDYYTTTEQDPESKASEWSNRLDYITGDMVVGENIDGVRQVFECIKDINPSETEVALTNTTHWEYKRDAKFLLVEDWVYPDPTTPELGQSLAGFDNIAFPPLNTDMTANNGYTAANNDRTELTLKALYPTTGSANGKGKIYFCAGPYLAALPGYYRIISKNPDSGGEGRPYTQRVRTPDSHSYIDPSRMPKQLTVKGVETFSFDHISWDSRTSGTKETNPGPAIFKTGDGSELNHVEINAMAFYRGRLFLSAADTLFSSRIGDYDNLWLADPGNISSADPIDLQASSNKYSKINALVPFSDFLFINTDSDTQFELLGSENQITPFTAELASTSFYSTSPLVDPVLMGSQIYFAAPNKIFIYFSSQAANLNTAIEVSQHCPGFLPKDMSDITVGNSKDTLFISDKEIGNHLYVYTNRFSGDQVVQNAFHRWIFPEGVQIFSTSFNEDSLWVCLGLPYTDAEGVYNEDTYKLTLVKLITSDEDLTIPRLDNRVKFVIDETNTSYNSETGQTTFTVPLNYNKFDTIVLHDGFGNDNFTTLEILSQTIVRTETDDGKCELVVSGNLTSGTIYIGTAFKMDVELSPLFVRDENNNVRDGVLSLRTLHLRHFETGNYAVEVARRGRPKVIKTFNSQQLGEYGTVFPTEIVETQGESVAKIMAFSHETSIHITSDAHTPCNITNLEVKGKFKPVYSSLDK